MSCYDVAICLIYRKRLKRHAAFCLFYAVCNDNMASTGREVILESHLPVLTHIAQMVNTEIDVESLAAYLLANISPFGAKFVASARNEKKEFHMIALEAMRKW